MHRVFLSYEYEHDAASARAVRSAWVAQGGTATLESAQGSSDAAVQNWIDRQLEMAAVTIVLWSPHTASSSWVGYEIERTKMLGKGLLGIDITGMHDARRTGRKPKPAVLGGHALYHWLMDDGVRNLASWVANAVDSARPAVAMTT